MLDHWFILYTTCCIITGLFISLKKHCENVSEKEPIFADEVATVRALLKNKNAEKYRVMVFRVVPRLSGLLGS
jgi:hypothetical protein